MSATVEFFYDFSSPYTYLAWTQLGPLMKRTGATLVNRPMLLGGVFKLTDNTMPARVMNKASYMAKDLKDWQDAYGVEFSFTPHFPLNTLKAMRGAIAAQEKGIHDAYAARLWRAAWVEGANLTELDVLAALAAEAGFPRDEFVAALENPAIKQKLIDATGEAAERGAFGAPTFYVNKDDMYWGNDRLDLMERAIKRAG